MPRRKCPTCEQYLVKTGPRAHQAPAIWIGHKTWCPKFGRDTVVPPAPKASVVESGIPRGKKIERPKGICRGCGRHRVLHLVTGLCSVCEQLVKTPLPPPRPVIMCETSHADEILGDILDPPEPYEDEPEDG